MSALEKEPAHELVATYRGVPNKLESQPEHDKWRRFIDILMPWLRRKRELGDDYLEAHVLNERAKAYLKCAQAKESLARANKTAVETAALASRIDRERQSDGAPPQALQDGDGLPSGLERDLEALEDKLKMAKLKYGARLLLVEVKPVDKDN